MGVFTPFLAKRTLDFLTGAAEATAPAERWCGLCDIDGSEIADSVIGYSRASAVFAEAASPQGSASILSTMTFALTNNVALTIFSVGLWDASAGGNGMVLGSLKTVRTVQANGAGYVVSELSIMLS